MQIPHSIRIRHKEIPFLILVSMLGTFVTSRVFTFAFPNLFLSVRGEHIHHFAYGIILLSLTNLFSLLVPQNHRTQMRLSILYGISLGLAFDEFGMWIRLEDIYWSRVNFDAVIVVTLVFLNIIFFDGFWRSWGNKLHSFFTKIFN